jgi:hypothetical protein
MRVPRVNPNGPTRRQSQRPQLSRLLLTQEPRQPRAWLIFDVGRKNMRLLLLSISLAASLHAVKPPPTSMLEAVATAPEARIALCRQSVIDELQIVQGPRKLDPKEVKAITAILGSQTSYKNDQTKKFCIVVWDFKAVLHDEKNSRMIGVWICTSCRDVGIEINRETGGGGELTPEA